MAVPQEGSVEKHQLFSDSVVSGGSNPMGLGGYLWREGDAAAMQVTLGKAFEGVPGRAHGGIVAALIDETMGLVLAVNDVLAFTVQLDITYLAPAPIDQAIIARAWLERRDGRKLFISARVQANDTDVASAKALFLAVDPARFLEGITALE
jgi:acyl-coenzyme A thioesterase PaaI-like protein